MLAVGSVGLGLVWGWLLAHLAGQLRRPLLTIAGGCAATLLLATEVLLLADWQAVAVLTCATGIALVLHVAWRVSLRRRFRRRRREGSS